MTKQNICSESVGFALKAAAVAGFASRVLRVLPPWSAPAHTAQRARPQRQRWQLTVLAGKQAKETKLDTVSRMLT